MFRLKYYTLSHNNVTGKRISGRITGKTPKIWSEITGRPYTKCDICLDTGYPVQP